MCFARRGGVGHARMVAVRSEKLERFEDLIMVCPLDGFITAWSVDIENSIKTITWK